MKKRMRHCILLPLIVLFASFSIISCSKENPVGVLIRQTWGNYDYFTYKLHATWEYQANYPADNSYVNITHYIFGQEYIAPYTGWQVVVSYFGVPQYYYLDAKTEDAIYGYIPSIEEWSLRYSVPLIIGNKWHVEMKTIDFYTDIEYKVTIIREIIGRESVSIMAGTFENCFKLIMHEEWEAVDTTFADSNYYYDAECWYAPYVGLIEMIVINTDKQYLEGYSKILKQFKQGSESSAYPYEDKCLKELDRKMIISISRHWRL